MNNCEMKKQDSKPYDPVAEKAILAAMLDDPSLVLKAKVRGVEDLFYDLRHTAIFSGMVKLAETGTDINCLNLSIQQPNLDLAYMAEILSEGALSSSWEFYLNRLQEDYQFRAKERIGIQLAEGVGIEAAIAQLQKLKRESAPPKTFNRQQQLHELLEYIENCQNQGTAFFGVPTGFPGIDTMFGGMGSGDYVIIAGRPSHGKTTLCLNILENISRDSGVPTGLISLEMSERSLLLKSLSNLSGLSVNTILTEGSTEGNLPRIFGAFNKLNDFPLHVIRPKDFTILTVSDYGRKMVEEFGIKVLAIDYLQLIRGSRKFENKNIEVSEVSNAIKQLAVELGIPIIVLCQFNRSVEKQERRPRLSDFRDSGSIEQDCDKAMLLYCEDETEERDYSVPMKIIIAKNREGATGECQLLFRKNLSRFESCSKFDANI